MRILVHCIHYPVCSGRYAVDAFKRLGHEVYHIGVETGRNIWGMQVPEEYAWSQEIPPQGWQPDVAILMDTAYQWHYEGDAPTIVWSVDNHVRDLRQEGITHYFLAHQSVTITEWGDDCTWLPCAYDPVAFPSSPIPFARRKWDVCMIGVMYPQRWALVEAMRTAGLKVLAGTGLVYDAYRAAYQNSRVALVSSFNGDLPIRLFEGAGMGCAVLSDEIADLDLLGKDTPIWRYNSIESAVYKAQNIGEIEACEAATWAKPHTWDARAQVILDWLEGRK